MKKILLLILFTLSVFFAYGATKEETDNLADLLEDMELEVNR